MIVTYFGEAVPFGISRRNLDHKFYKPSQGPSRSELHIKVALRQRHFRRFDVYIDDWREGDYAFAVLIKLGIRWPFVAIRSGWQDARP